MRRARDDPGTPAAAWQSVAPGDRIARSRGDARLSLATGSAAAFAPALRPYEAFGFAYCGPVGSCVEDSDNLFMSVRLRHDAA